jgi:hypothetical protein
MKSDKLCESNNQMIQLNDDDGRLRNLIEWSDRMIDDLDRSNDTIERRWSTEYFPFLLVKQCYMKPKTRSQTNALQKQKQHNDDTDTAERLQ